jgi:hypothetical protein
MFVLINVHRNFAVVGKHESDEALRKFAWLELPHVPCVVCKCDESDDFEKFTDFQLKEMYGALTKTEDLKSLGFGIEGLRFLVFDTIEKIEPLDIVKCEIIAQAEKVVEPYAIYRYVKGSFFPQRMSDLYEPEGPFVERDAAFESAVKDITPAARVLTVSTAPVRDVQPAKAPPPRESTPRAHKPAPAAPVKPAQDFSKAIPLAIKQPWL